jgi:hypothetical protein
MELRPINSARCADARKDDLDDMEALAARSAHFDDLGCGVVSETRSRALELVEPRLHLQARPDGVSRVLALIDLARSSSLKSRKSPLPFAE